MTAFIEELVTVLSKQLDLYDQVLALSDEERTALVSKKPDQVLGLVRRKETILLQIKTLEESRRLLCMRISKGLNLAVSLPTLREIRDHVPESALSSRLEQLRNRMLASMESLQQANARNALICENGIDIIHRIVHSAVEANAHDEAPAYGPRNSSSRRGVPGLYKGQL